MRYKTVGAKTIYSFGNGNYILTEQNRNYLLIGTKWLDEINYKFHRLMNKTDEIIINELDVELNTYKGVVE